VTGRLRVAPIVEGHGEFLCVGNLLRRIWYELLGGQFIEVQKPIRHHQGTLLQPEGMSRAIRLALKSLNTPPSTDPSLVLVLIDSEGECPARLGPDLLNVAKRVDPRADVACVLAHVMYETWFVAASSSLASFLDLGSADPPLDPEGMELGKSWIAKRVRGPKYVETFHQSKMTSAMDLAQCRTASPSFDKLCRELEKRLS
jgi:hypothetical protein